MPAPHASRTLAEHALATFPPPSFLTMPALGVDISEHDIRYLSFEKEKHTRRVEACGTIPLADGVIRRGEVADLDARTQALATLRERENARFVRASLPEQRSYIFRTTVPASSKRDEIHTVLEFQLEEYVPISAAEAVFDHRISRVHRREGHLDLSVTVFPREVVERYMAALSRAGFVPLSFEIEPQAIVRAVVPRGDEGTHLIINVSKHRTGLFVVVNRAVSFTSSLEIGGAPLIKALAEAAGTDRRAAAARLRSEGLAALREGGGAPEQVAETLTRLREEVERHMNYWNSRHDEEDDQVPQVEDVVLCGAFGGIPGLSEALAALPVPVRQADVWCNALSFDESVPPIHRRDSFGYATAVGLALHEGGVS